MPELEPTTISTELVHPSPDTDLFDGDSLSEHEMKGEFADVYTALEKLDERSKNHEALAPREIVPGRADLIQNQEINFIKDEKGLLVTFKLTKDTWEKISVVYQANPAEEGYISYGHGDSEIVTAPANVVVNNNLEIKIAKPETGWNALDGVVMIRPIQEAGRTGGSQQTVADLKAAFEQVLGVEDPFNESQGEADAAADRYAWHHKLSDTEAAGVDTLVPALEKKEVFDGYSTLVEPGKSREYEAKHGEVANFHKVNKYHLADILRFGLASTQERHKRSCMAVGLNSYNDLRTGGADSVFVRTVTEANLSQQDEVFDSTAIIMNPSLMDRTDWYAYSYDHNGSTDPEALNDRLSPDELLAKINSHPEETRTNEQMFNAGIGKESFMGIAVESTFHKDELVRILLEQGVSECNGIPIADFIKVTESWAQVVDIAHGRELRTLSPGEEGQIPALPQFGWASESEIVL
ncbi:MAG: hypothetical protein WAQ27_05835 [Candidatus Microsaccharimonas sp.]